MTLGILVQRFGTYIRDSYSTDELAADAQMSADAASADDFPEDLRHMRDCVSHHLILLVLLARTDNDFAVEERDVIVEHCISMARRRGVEIMGEHMQIFVDYVSIFRPSLLQLDPALSALIRAHNQEIGDLLRAAHSVIVADGTTRPEELHFFTELNADIEAALASSGGNQLAH